MPFPDSENKHIYFRYLFEKYKVRLHDYLKKITGSHEVAEDITQEIFTKLWKKGNDLHTIENMEQYIFRMAHNESMDFFNRTALDAKMIKALKSRIVLSSNNVAEQLHHNELKTFIEKGIKSLSPQRRKVYQLSRQEGLSIEEIAGQIGLTPNTVKNHLVEALRQMRRFTNQHSGENIALVAFILATYVRI